MPVHWPPIHWYVFEVKTTTIDIGANEASPIEQEEELNMVSIVSFSSTEEPTPATAIHLSSARNRLSFLHLYHILAMITITVLLLEGVAEIGMRSRNNLRRDFKQSSLENGSYRSGNCKRK